MPRAHRPGDNSCPRIHAATIVDGTGKVLRNATIVVQGSKITGVDTSGPSPASPATYDLGRLTVMPGMIDVHAHLGWHFGPDRRDGAGSRTAAENISFNAEDGDGTVMAGFTTIQGPGQANDVEL